ncbi:MFS transporter [Motiliproteus sp. SC1-56]|uniref:MFS transporter n=1 Tax=Motiliproteus sp. SC1-56 TaxID=2799565 RepID=UPI001A902EDF|nr:MFS transporter [Motiliproteus sp. SC1-56]
MECPGSSYWRLSSFYLAYFALLGGIVPFWGLYLQSLGFDEVAIGALMAMLMATRIIAPNLWGWLADRSGRRVLVIRLGAFATLAVFSFAFEAKGFGQLLWLMFGFSFFWNGILPQFEVVTLRALGEHKHRYSRVRVWGSVGFILAVVLLGALFDYVEIGYLVPILWGLMLLLALSTLWVPATTENVVSRHHGALSATLRRPEVLAFLGVCLLIQLGHGPYYSFYSIYMAEQGYGKVAIGLLWALGVVAEVGVFLVMHRLIAFVGLRRLVLASLLTCVLRWWLTAGYPDVLPLVLIAQVLHAVTFGCLHAAAIALVHHFFPASTQGQGQALYSSVGFGIGGALGAYLSGVIWSGFDGEAIFWFAAVVSLMGWVVAWRWLKLASM